MSHDQHTEQPSELIPPRDELLDTVARVQWLISPIAAMALVLDGTRYFTEEQIRAALDGPADD